MIELLKSGDIIARRYRVEKYVASGQSAHVYETTDSITGRVVVCKTSRPERGAVGRARVLDQYNRLVEISSPSLARAFTFEEHTATDGESLGVLVLEKIDGAPARRWMGGQPLRSRLKVAAGTAEALALLHNAGIPHGDVHLGNCVVTATDCVVLIDPAAAEFGRTHSSESAQLVVVTEPSAVDDVGQFGQLLRSLLDSDVAVLQPIIDSLLGADDARPSAAVVAAQLKELLARERLPGETTASFASLGTHYKANVEARRRQYIRNKQARELAVAQFIEDLRKTAASLGVTVNGPNPTRGSFEEEKRANDDVRGSFFGRAIFCSSPDNERWYLEFSEHLEFKKPWVDEKEGCLGTGSSRIELNKRSLAETLELRVAADGEEAPVVYICSEDFDRRADTNWMERSLRILIGDRVPALLEPLLFPGEKQPIPPLRDAALDENGDVTNGEVSGLAVLKQACFICLQTIRGAVPGDPDVGSTLGNILFARGQRVTEILAEVVQQLSALFSRFIDVLYWLDVTNIDRDTRTLQVEVAVRPHGEQPVVWSYSLNFEDYDGKPPNPMLAMPGVNPANLAPREPDE